MIEETELEETEDADAIYEQMRDDEIFKKQDTFKRFT